MKLKYLLDNCLPLNRKERFFTGTVFPMIVCKDNFKYFHLFIDLLEEHSGIKIDANPKTTNIQFFTEYSLIESLYGKSKKRFNNVPKTKDTPDIIIFIEGDVKALIGIEAKMFDYPKPVELEKQMKKQSHILDCIKTNLCRIINCKISRVYHYALLPKGYIDRAMPKGINILTWDDLLNKYKGVYENDYFIGMLEYALNEYSGLVGKGVDSFGFNSKYRIEGLKVYDNFKNENKEYKIIGRNKGIAGFIKDIDENKWMTFKYEINNIEDPPNKNWITVEKFVELVDSYKK